MAIHFNPFIGSHYKTSLTRLLIVGQSHHGKPEEAEERELTTRVVRGHLSGDARLRFFSKIPRIIAEDVNLYDEQEVFSRIAIYNYVQVLLPETRSFPTSAIWTAGEEPFREVLKRLDPTHILVFGKQTYKNLPSFDGREERRKFGPNSSELLGEYRTPSGHAFTVGIPHPSSTACSPRVWAEPAKWFINLREWPSPR